jgi:AraC-like DNA-binding protein
MISRSSSDARDEAEGGPSKRQAAAVLQEPTWTRPNDALTEVLRDLRLVQSFYCHSELTAPWGLSLPPEDYGVFHFVADGEAWLQRPGNEATRLGKGDFVLCAPGVAHSASSAVGVPCRNVLELPYETVDDRAMLLRYGGNGARTVLACGGVRFEDPAAHPLVALMPDVLHIRANQGGEAVLLRQMLEAMGSEALNPRPGGTTVMLRLADILVIHAVRSWLEVGADDRTGWVGALRDPQVGRAIVQMHREPERDWTVAALAASVHMSRSVFSDRFAALVGAPPLLYLTRWRMHLAARWLREDRTSLGEVATRLGYESEPSFSRAFKRHIGVPPGALRVRPAGRRRGAPTAA